MAKDIIDLFSAGGLPLVLAAGFVIALIWTIKYFVHQIDSSVIERKELMELSKAEKKELMEKFELMLNNHCRMVSESLDRQAEVFTHLIDKIDMLIRK